MLIVVAALINGGLYISKLRKLLALVEERWPEKWESLGQPNPLTFSKGVLRDSKKVWGFVRNPGVISDSDIAELMQVLRKHLIAHFVLFGFLVLWIIGFVVFLFVTL
jgi:hypothetical protein